MHKPAMLEMFDAPQNLQSLFPRHDSGELGWLPAVDVQILPDAVVVRAALPGVSKDDIRVEFAAGSLTLSGRRRGSEAGGWVRQEVPPGPFRRVVSLPGAVQAAAALASHKDGILEIRLPTHPSGPPCSVMIH